MPVLAIGQSQISSRNLIQTHWKSPQYWYHIELYQKRSLFNIRSICDSVARMCHITKGHYVTTYLWPWHHKKPKSIMISVQNGQAQIKWPCDIRWDGLRCLSDTFVICLGIVTRFGNCTNVWLWTNAVCCCLFLCFFCVLLLFVLFIKNKSMLIWPFAL